jgi:hypothetical protein
MLITRKLTAKVSDFLDKVGKSFKLIKCSGSAYVEFSLKGRKVLETKLRQGMSISDVNFDRVIITSDIAQLIEYWAADYVLDFKLSSPVANQVLCQEAFIGEGIQEMLPLDESRRRAVIVSDTDIYIGSNGFNVINSEATSAILLEANKELIVTSSAQLNAYHSESLERNFVTQPFSNIRFIAEGVTPTATYLNSNNAHYVDVKIPPELDGVPFTVTSRSNALTGSAEAEGKVFWNVQLWSTVNGLADDTLVNQATVGTIGSVPAGYTTLSTKTLTLNEGWQRIYFISRKNGWEQVFSDGDTTFAEVEFLKTTDLNFNRGAKVQIYTERSA